MKHLFTILLIVTAMSLPAFAAFPFYSVSTNRAVLEDTVADNTTELSGIKDISGLNDGEPLTDVVFKVTRAVVKIAQLDSSLVGTNAGVMTIYIGNYENGAQANSNFNFIRTDSINVATGAEVIDSSSMGTAYTTGTKAAGFFANVINYNPSIVTATRAGNSTLVNDSIRTTYSVPPWVAMSDTATIRAIGLGTGQGVSWTNTPPAGARMWVKIRPSFTHMQVRMAAANVDASQCVRYRVRVEKLPAIKLLTQ
jgi:hypothetical protein